MMMDILSSNRGPILEALHEAQDQLGALIHYLEKEDTPGLQAALEAAQSLRMEVYR
jgi:prephenate dehydrogenase